jgi:hypothetical protein
VFTGSIARTGERASGNTVHMRTGEAIREMIDRYSARSKMVLYLSLAKLKNMYSVMDSIYSSRTIIRCLFYKK